MKSWTTAFATRVIARTLTEEQGVKSTCLRSLRWIDFNTFTWAFRWIILFSFIAHKGVAAELNPDLIRGDKTEKLVSVVQNTYFTKALRPQITLVTGRFLEEAYTKTSYSGARISFFPTEWIGLELHSATTNVQDSVDRTALNSLKYCKADENCTDPATRILVSPDPEVNPVRKIVEGSLTAVPFYGKINLAGYAIIYSDIFLAAGLGRFHTDQGEKKSIHLGFGQRFYLNQYLSFHIDFKQRRWREIRAGLDGQRSIWCIDMGIGAFLWK